VALPLASGCAGETREEKEYVYDPYDGPPAYPNRRPKFELPSGDVGLTSDNGSDTVTVLALDEGTVLGSAPVGRTPVDNDGPHHLTVDRDAGFVYVALAYPAAAITPGPHAAHGSSQRSGFVQKLALDDLRVVGEVRVDTNPGDIVASADGKRLVVSHYDLAKALVAGATYEERLATLAVIDPAKILPSGSVDPVRIPVCIAPHAVSLTRPAGEVAHVACYGEDAIAVVDLEDESKPVELVPVGPGAGSPGAPEYGPYSLTPSRSGQVLAVGNTESHDVRFFDVEARAMSAIVVDTQGAPYFVAWSLDDASVFVPTQGPDAIVVADAATGAIVDSRSFDEECARPHEAVFGKDDATLYVVCEGDHQGPGAVLALDPLTLETVRTYPVGVYPDRLFLWEEP
jgi:DNA-binding beta-propeller fold protein YncE